MNLKQARLGILVTPVTALYTGTVVSYAPATSISDLFTLVLTDVAGASSSIVIGMAVEAGEELVRIRTISIGVGIVTLTLAENGVSSAAGGGFVVGATVYVYNVFYPLPRYQRLAQNIVTEYGDDSNQLSEWILNGVTDENSDEHKLYWELTVDGKINLYADTEWDYWVARQVKGQGTGDKTYSIEQRNGSGITGSVKKNFSVADEGYLYIAPYELYKDYDVGWSDLGGSDSARSKASMPPIPRVEPQCARPALNTNVTFNAITSFAIYQTWGGAAATIKSYAWDGGAGAVYTGDQVSHDVVVKWTTSGFRYLKLTLTDSNDVVAIRYIPVWVGVTPYSQVTKCEASFGLQSGWSIDLEFVAPPTVLRHSLVCIVDLDTLETLFLGFIWPASYSYNFEQSKLNVTFLPAFAYLTHVFSYPFRVIGIKADPVDWDHMDHNSFSRGIYFLLRWHSNYLELANAQWDATPNTRLEYICDYNAGTLLEQMVAKAQSAYYSLYGDRFGGFVAIEDLLYGETIVGAAYDAQTLDFTNYDLIQIIEYLYGEDQISFLRMSGFYFDANIDLKPIIINAPSHPGNYGRPAEVGGLIAKQTGYTEMVRWAGRRIGLSNVARKYTAIPVLDIDPVTYKMIDLPDDTRIVVETIRLIFVTEMQHWTQTITGRTFGTTADAIVAPTTPTPTIPEVIPDLPTPDVGEDDDIVIITNDTQMGCSDDFLLGVPSWTNIKGGALASATGKIMCFDVAPTGEAWLCTHEVGGGNPSLNGIFYCGSIKGGSWTLVKSETAMQAETFTGQGYVETLAVDDDGTVWAPITNAYVAPVMYGNFQYYTGVSGVLGVLQNRICDPPGGAGANLGYWGGNQFLCRSNGATSWVGISETGAHYGYWDFGADAYVDVGVYLGNAGALAPTSHMYFGNNVSTAAGAVVHAGGAPLHPLVVDGSIYWLRNADGYLMIDAAIQAIPNDIFPDNGVFSVSGASGGGYTTVKSSVELIWIAQSAAANNSKRNIAYTVDGGVDGWSLDKDGNWVIAVGAWPASSNVPIVKFVTLT